MKSDRRLLIFVLCSVLSISQAYAQDASSSVQNESTNDVNASSSSVQKVEPVTASEGYDDEELATLTSGLLAILIALQGNPAAGN